MNEEQVKALTIEVLKERYPWLLKDNEIFARQCTNHMAFGGKHRDTYGWIEERDGVFVATGLSPYGRSTSEFKDLKDAIHFCIKERFHFKN